MEFDTRVTGAAFAVLFLVVGGGTITSPMPTTLRYGITAGLLVFGLLVLFVGIRHGEYRATR
jgi:hypothetical protein